MNLKTLSDKFMAGLTLRQPGFTNSAYERRTASNKVLCN